MFNGSIALLPAGTTWDAKSRQVRFGGAFQGAAPAPVGARFTGGGGTIDGRDDLSGVMNVSGEAAVRDCMAKTNTTYAVVVYPDMS